MKTSRKFKRALYHDQSPSIADYFEIRHPSLFVTDITQSWLDICVADSLPGTDQAELDPDENGWSSVHPVDRNHGKDEIALDSVSAKRNVIWTERIHNGDQVRRLVKATDGRNRLFLVSQKNSYSRLSITRSLFESLVSECNVFPQFLDFVLCFGTRSFELEIGTPHMRFKPLAIENMGELSDGYECAYVLRLAELNNRGDGERPWSIRQFAVYQQYVSISNSSTWIYLALTKRSEGRLESFLRDEEETGINNPFETHLLLLDTALANWRRYLGWLSVETTDRGNRIIVSSVENDDLVPVADFDERQRLKQLEDDLVDVRLILDSTLDTVESMLERYVEFSSTKSRTKAEIDPSDLAAEDLIIRLLQEKRQDIRLLNTKIEALRTKVAGTTELVSILLNVTNGHSLKVLAEESKADNAAMKELTERGFKDAVAVKVLTIVTLVYLPTTVVTNFFSTQFVSQVSDGSGRSGHLEVQSNWWILAAVSLPLTMVTLYIWWFWVEKQAHGRYPTWFRIVRDGAQKSWFRITSVQGSTRGRDPRHHNRDIEI